MNRHDDVEDPGDDYWRNLQAELDEMERVDPKIAQATKRFYEAIEDLNAAARRRNQREKGDT